MALLLALMGKLLLFLLLVLWPSRRLHLLAGGGGGVRAILVDGGKRTDRIMATAAIIGAVNAVIG